MSIDDGEGTWYIGGTMMDQVTVLLDSEYEGVSSITLFARRPFFGDLYMESIGNIDASGTEQIFRR
ncbi:hypothetical protein ACFVTX_15935 [Agromyces sp. NPDC058136]|uniref:hypothetical protein n=1 Tax=Agromyces sp. NPDC058136 TaxID=3346354 RepID=UPI0036DF9714